MFGYIAIDKSKLEAKEIGLYQTFMCGLCLSTKKLYGNYPRNFVNYDINFLNVLLHSFLQKDVEIFYGKCLSSPFKKRSLLKIGELTDRLASANVLLAYYNLLDDTLDEKSPAKKALLRSLKKAYNKAKTDESEMESVIALLYGQLRAEEKAGQQNLDKVCDNFAKLTQKIVTIAAGQKNEKLETLAYNLGKWVYLIDALDDIEKDIKRKNYNPLVSYFGQEKDSQSFMAKHKDELNFLFFTTLNRIAESYNDLNLTKYACLLNNVLYSQIRDKTKSLLGQKEEKGEK